MAWDKGKKKEGRGRDRQRQKERGKEEREGNEGRENETRFTEKVIKLAATSTPHNYNQYPGLARVLLHRTHPITPTHTTTTHAFFFFCN